MQKLKLLAVSLTFATLATGCTTMSAGGSDMAGIKSTRGSESAQITRAEAEQYARQQEIVSRELELERQKRRNTTGSINDVTNTVRNLTGLIRSF